MSNWFSISLGARYLEENFRINEEQLCPVVSSPVEFPSNAFRKRKRKKIHQTPEPISQDNVSVGNNSLGIQMMDSISGLSETNRSRARELATSERRSILNYGILSQAPASLSGNHPPQNENPFPADEQDSSDDDTHLYEDEPPTKIAAMLDAIMFSESNLKY